MNVKYDNIIENKYTLFVNIYNTTIEEKITDIEYKKIGDVCEINFGKRVIKKEVETNEKDDVLYPCYGGGDISFYMTKYNREGKNLIISRFGLSKKCIRIVNCKFWLNDSGFTLTSNYEYLNQDYLNYIMLEKQIDVYNISSGSCQKNINIDDFKNIKIPVPDIKVQNKIVSTLNIFNNNNETCKKYIEESNFILKTYIDLHCDEKNMKLGDICDFHSSKYNSGDMDNDGPYDFYSGKATNPVGKHSKSNFNFDEYIGIIKGGGAGKEKYGDQIGLGKSFYLTGKNAISNGMYILKIKDDKYITTKYLYYYLGNIKNKIMDLATYTTGLGNIKQDTLKNIKIPIPDINIQKQIISFCNELTKNIEYTKNQIQNNKKLMKQIITKSLNLSIDVKSDMESEKE